MPGHSRLLLDEPTLQVLPSLAVAIGLNEAILLQQLHFWMSSPRDHGVMHDGRRWIYNSLPQWHEQLPFWSEDTIRRTFKSLTDKGLVLAEKLSSDFRNRTNYYSIDYAALDLAHAAISPDHAAESPDASQQDARMHECKTAACMSAKPPLLHTEKTTERTTENIPEPASPGTDLVLSGEVEKPKARRKSPAAKADETELQAECRRIWNAYSDAYFNRYGVEPVRNAKVNTQVKQIAQRLGAEGSGVAEFYVSRVNDAFIVRGCHDLGLLLSRCESFRTQWATGNSITATRARQVDQTQANFSAADEAMALIQKRRANNA